jgi:hypothetical protein
MPNVIVNKVVVQYKFKINRNIKLSSLIAQLMRKNLFIALPMKYCHINVNTIPLKINDYNCKLIKDINTYGKYKDSYELINNLLLGSYSYHGRLKQMIKDASYGQILFHIKGNINEPIVELDVNGLYAFSMTQLRIPKGKPKWINGLFDDIMDYTFIIKVEILDVIEKQWSRFKKDNVYTIDNITYKDLSKYQDAKIKIISGIYWESMEYIDNNDVLNNLLAIKSQINDADEIRKIKNQINFIHGFLLTKDKIKKVIKTKDELESFIEMNEPLLLGYHMKRADEDNNQLYYVYLKRTYDLKFTNV